MSKLEWILEKFVYMLLGFAVAMLLSLGGCMQGLIPEGTVIDWCTDSVYEHLRNDLAYTPEQIEEIAGAVRGECLADLLEFLERTGG